MKTLLIDNYDSFTYNLFQLLADVNGVEPLVLTNDDHEGFDELAPDAFDAIVISPGPGRPEVERDFGISQRALSLLQKPILGVCLGHQGLCLSAGSRIVRAPEPFHGRSSAIRHSGHPLFRDIPSPFEAVRYHSLIAIEPGPALETIARTEDGLVMAVAHRSRPHFGVQFHPESIGTCDGRRLLDNFRALSSPRVQAAHPGDNPGPQRPVVPPRLRVAIEQMPRAPDPERVFDACFGALPNALWLDSSAVIDGYSRHSILAFPSDRHGELVSYDVVSRRVMVEQLSTGRVEHHRETLFDYLKREQRARRVEDPGLDFEFALGYVGYLGYELKADAGAAVRHRSPFPDGRFAFCDRAYVFDHQSGHATLLALHDASSEPAARQWLAETRSRLAELSEAERTSVPVSRAGAPRGVELEDERAAYVRKVERCLEAISDGESYEVCLTQRVTLPFRGDPLDTYRLLRRENPAPYSAFLRFEGCSVASASPERFLSIDRFGRAESKPIKGTARRFRDPEADRRAAEDLVASEKERAENLMIVDLVRNDLGRVSEIGSVTVPQLFDVESYATVHQLVSTIRSQLRHDLDAVDCVRACFPGGSMTGAPKLRTMEIIDELESSARGIYSGAIGYLSLNGAADLSIVIRTIVFSDGRAMIGTGGAIVALSNPDAEFDEAQLKTEALLSVLAQIQVEEASAPRASVETPARVGGPS